MIKINLNKILNASIFMVPVIGIGFSIGFGIYWYRRYCNTITFENIEKNYKKKLEWEKDLGIYAISMPKFFISKLKKQKCILLIGGYKDIPYVWNELEKYLVFDGFDYYAPRTQGCGRSFFQVVNYRDWIITYLEAIHILQDQYESIDIIAFSTGCVIALYLSQFIYKCKIKNVFLCAPFLLSKPYFSIGLFYGQNIFSKILNRICAYTLRFRIKFHNKFAGYRDTHYIPNSINDYCEICGDLQTETSLFEFIQFRPKKLNVSNIVVLYPNDDDIIGDINEQKKIISKSFAKSIDLISIPSYLNSNNNTSIDINSLPQKCGHVMFKEHPIIIQNIYDNLKIYM